MSRSFDEVLDGWAHDAAFRRSFTERLRAAPHVGFCWECPPITAATVSRPFEHAIVDSPLLARIPADPEPFREHFRPDRPIVTFESLGRDAVLVAPCPRGPESAYGHLAAFLRQAPADQIDALWIEVAQAVRARLGPRPLWLSTAGLGVAWLHVRLDSRPKYYRTRVYADERP